MGHQPRRDPPRGHAGGLPEVTRGGARGPRHEPSLSSRGGGRGESGRDRSGRLGGTRAREAAAAGNGDPEMRMRRGVREARRGRKAETEERKRRLGQGEGRELV